MIRHGVDGEIPAAQILRQAIGKGHGLRVAAIQIIAIRAESGDLIRLARHQHSHGAVLDPRFHHALAGKAALGLRRQRAGADIIIVRGHAACHIAHAAAHGVSLIARRVEAAQHLQRPRRQFKAHQRAPPCFLFLPIIYKNQTQCKRKVAVALAQNPGYNEQVSTRTEVLTMKNAKRALLLSLALLMIALPALAAGKLQTDQENLWEVKTDWSHDAYLFAKVTNVGDRDISISSGVFEAYDAEGQPIASDDYAEAYVECLKPGEYTYVRMYGEIEDETKTAADHMLTLAGKSDSSVDTLRLPCVTELRLNESMGWYTEDYMYVTVTNNTEQDLYDISIVAALLDQDGSILYLDEDSLFNDRALTAGSTMIFRMDIPEHFKALYEAKGLTPVSVDAIAYVNIEKD